jgi:hypothetical protein
MMPISRRSVLGAAAAVLSSVAHIGSSDGDTRTGSVETDSALAFLDDDNEEFYREVDSNSELTIDISGDQTAISLLADFDEPERLENGDIYSIQIVPKELPEGQEEQ